jgi:soluble lytic murein transglycosylase-like protein
MTDEIKHRYYCVIKANALKYNLDEYLLAKQIHAESTFKWWTGNDIAFGAMGVRPKYWSHVLYRIDTNLIQYLETEQDHIKYLKRIGYGIEVGSYVMRHYLDRNDNNYPLALIGYWAGMNSKEYRRAKRSDEYLRNNDYLNKILN